MKLTKRNLFRTMSYAVVLTLTQPSIHAQRIFNAKTLETTAELKEWRDTMEDFFEWKVWAEKAEKAAAANEPFPTPPGEALGVSKIQEKIAVLQRLADRKSKPRPVPEMALSDNLFNLRQAINSSEAYLNELTRDLETVTAIKEKMNLLNQASNAIARALMRNEAAVLAALGGPPAATAYNNLLDAFARAIPDTIRPAAMDVNSKRIAVQSELNKKAPAHREFIQKATQKAKEIESRDGGSSGQSSRGGSGSGSGSSGDRRPGGGSSPGTPPGSDRPTERPSGPSGDTRDNRERSRERPFGDATTRGGPLRYLVDTDIFYVPGMPGVPLKWRIDRPPKDLPIVVPPQGRVLLFAAFPDLPARMNITAEFEEGSVKEITTFEGKCGDQVDKNSLEWRNISADSSATINATLTHDNGHVFPISSRGVTPFMSLIGWNYRPKPRSGPTRPQAAPENEGTRSHAGVLVVAMMNDATAEIPVLNRSESKSLKLKVTKDNWLFGLGFINKAEVEISAGSDRMPIDFWDSFSKDEGTVQSNIWRNESGPTFWANFTPSVKLKSGRYGFLKWRSQWINEDLFIAGAGAFPDNRTLSTYRMVLLAVRMQSQCR